MGTSLTIRAILAADLIYSLASVAVYAVLLLAYRRWKRRRAPVAPAPVLIDTPDDICWHCPICHKAANPQLLFLEQRRCIQSGKLCAPCSHALHGDTSAAAADGTAVALLDLMQRPDGLLSPDAVAFRRSLLALFERLNLGRPIATGRCDTCGDAALLFSGRHADRQRCFGCCLPEFRS